MRALALVAALASALAAGPAVAASNAAAPSAVGAVTLVDQSGAHFRLADLKGRPTVVTFVATRCQDSCPLTDAMFARLARDGGREQLLTITLDPAYDTPFVMARHARELHATPDRWRVASGTPHDVERILAAFGVVREFDAMGMPDVHSTFVYVFDGSGRLLKTLPLSTNTVAEVRATVQQASH